MKYNESFILIDTITLKAKEEVIPDFVKFLIEKIKKEHPACKYNINIVPSDDLWEISGVIFTSEK